MDSRLEPLFRTTFRHAESTDARLGIRHDEEKDEGRKKDKKDNQNEALGTQEDKASVSVSALLGFLEGLVLSTENTPPDTEGTTPKTPDISLEAEFRPSHSPPSPAAAKAIQSYQNTAKAVHDKNIPEDHKPLQPLAPDEIPALSNEEIRTIHQLITDLSTLKKKNIQTLSLHIIGSFLDSLALAVKEALEKTNP